ncbi:MAG: hypothetical protein HYY29_03650 [Chloroflexi bacterium]|nr:hypothetical protein [Chloroflexota bacterium]
MRTQADTNVLLNDILAELSAIRQLLEWDKADMLERRQREEADKQEYVAMNQQFIEQGVARVRELQQQGIEEYRMALAASRAEHEALFHGGKGRPA